MQTMLGIGREGAMKKTLIFAGLIAAVLVVYAGVGPLITIHQIKSAVEQQDSEKLSEYVDFPTLRTNLKEQLNAELMKQAATGLKDNPFLALGLAFTPKLVEGVVDSFVTPSGISNLMAGKKPQQAEKEQPASGSDGTKRWEPFKNSRYTYDSSSKFSVWVKDDKSDEIRFVLTRDGLSWKLSNIIIAGFLSRHKELSAESKDPSGVRRLSFKNVSGKYYRSIKAGNLFCIQGIVLNNYSEIRSFIHVKGSLLDEKGVAVKQKLAFAGNTFSENELKGMSLEEINQALANQTGKVNANVNIKPQASVPFMIVFEDLPDNLSEFTVEAVSSAPGQ